MQCLLNVDECVTVGRIQISVIEVWNDSVKLGIHDPNANPRYREEILYLRSEDDDDGDVGLAFDSYEVESSSPFAVPML